MEEAWQSRPNAGWTRPSCRWPGLHSTVLHMHSVYCTALHITELFQENYLWRSSRTRVRSNWTVRVHGSELSYSPSPVTLSHVTSYPHVISCKITRRLLGNVTRGYWVGNQLARHLRGTIRCWLAINVMLLENVTSGYWVGNQLARHLIRMLIGNQHNDYIGMSNIYTFYIHWPHI